MKLRKARPGHGEFGDADGGPGRTGAVLADECADELIEEARLRCQQLRDNADQETERLRWSSLHHELGMAGYLASAQIPSGKRQALLCAARRACAEETGNADHDEYAILELITAARRRRLRR